MTRQRQLHPWAWWGWALLIAAATSLTTNPLVLILVAAAVTVVALTCRGDSVWARGLWAYYVLAGVVLVFRVLIFVVFGTSSPTATVLFTLPRFELPSWMAGIGLGGPVAAEPLLAAAYSALQLAVMIICVGAANALANPRRALRSVPSALYEVSVVIVVGMTMAPQLVISAVRVRRARRLRGHTTTASIMLPVLEDAIDRSLGLAAGMESRGFGSTRRARGRRWSTVLMLFGSAALTVGGYLLLAHGDVFAAQVHPLAPWTLLAGVLAVVAGLWASGRQLRITRYRPDPWRWPEWAVVACGLVTLTLMIWQLRTDPAALRPVTTPLAWPPLPTLILPGVLAAALPMLVDPRGRAPRPVVVAR
ncbi:energy-coupling factor transporter transmembrane component T [Enemella sp. A6]|uniref:energy-coupling factor transporter transmembrane component T n=1 Tax=Enemella sp. A6 TaxID=3440152 RepID=UPI003EBD9A70